MGRHANIVEQIVGEQRTGGVDRMAGHAAALAVENRPAASGRGVQRLAVAGYEAIASSDFGRLRNLTTVRIKNADR
jgi:hypothetical protein